jgi:hypothetical protein
VQAMEGLAPVLPRHFTAVAINHLQYKPLGGGGRGLLYSIFKISII